MNGVRFKLVLKQLFSASTFKRYFIVSICILFVNNSCIDNYNPPIPSQDSHNITVFGQITDNEGYQTVSIFNSASIVFVNTPIIDPVSGCKIILLDDLGNSFDFEEYRPGVYRVWMTKDFLKPGTSYKLIVTTNSGEEIESDYDQLPECPKIDSIYYIRKDIPTTNPNKPLQGIQFYIDMNATSVSSHYFKWEIEETYEHHAVYPKKIYWDGKTIKIANPPDYSMMVCWSTEKLKNHYTLSTVNLAQKKITMHPLHFVDNLTQRLTYGYSILVNQYALSPSAYIFWEQLRENNELGGLYGKQPISIKGNFKNLTSPNKKVLGLFQATSIRTKRIFVRNVNGLELFYPQCSASETPRVLPKNTFLYLGEGGVLEASCIECFAEGGSTTKPDFWPY